MGTSGKRLDEAVPLPAASYRYDTTRRYRVESGEDVDYADTLSEARCLAGEWQLERERNVVIVRQLGVPKRWLARLELPNVRLDELYEDGSGDALGSRRLAALAERIDREERRGRPESLAGRTGRPVVCLDSAPPRAFASVGIAAAWLGVRRQVMYRGLGRRGRVGSFRWEYADRILAEVAEHGSYQFQRGAGAEGAECTAADHAQTDALVACAKSALRVRKRKED